MIVVSYYAIVIAFFTYTVVGTNQKYLPIIIGVGEFIWWIHRGLIMIVFSCHCCVANTSNGYDICGSYVYMQVQENTK